MAVIVKIHSGFGNQLFQYAAGRSLALRRKTDLLLDAWSFQANTYRSYGLEQLNISAPCISLKRLQGEMQLRRKTYRPLRWFLRGVRSPWANRYLLDTMDGYDRRFDEPGRNLYLDGYWQSERYFAGIRDVLLKEFTFKSEPDAANREMLARITATKAVCVHVRRGDYVTSERHGLCGLDYYRDAMAWLQARLSGLEFFVFSDDPAWVAAYFPRNGAITLVTHNTGRADAEDLRLMTQCRYFVIANSTFSWWGAWLSQAPDKVVIAPKRWNASAKFSEKDVVPEGWVRM